MGSDNRQRDMDKVDKIQRISKIYNNFVIQLDILAGKQFNLLSNLIKKRETRNINEIKKELDQYE